MKKQTNINKRTGRTTIATLVLCAATCAAFGQDPWGGSGNGPDQGGGPGGPGGGRKPPLPPIIQALDTNHDGILEPDEIANAAQSLKTLLKSGSTSLTIPQLLGPPRHRPPTQPGGQANGRGADMQLANPGGQNDPPPPDSQGGQGGQAAQSGTDPQGGPPGPPPGPGGPGGPGRHHPPSPLMEALDTNHDGILEADEIANAAQSLKKLANANGEITRKELRPPPPPDDQGPPPPQESGTNGQSDSGPPPPPPPQ